MDPTDILNPMSPTGIVMQMAIQSGTSSTTTTPEAGGAAIVIIMAVALIVALVCRITR